MATPNSFACACLKQALFALLACPFLGSVCAASAVFVHLSIESDPGSDGFTTLVLAALYGMTLGPPLGLLCGILMIVPLWKARRAVVATLVFGSALAFSLPVAWFIQNPFVTFVAGVSGAIFGFVVVFQMEVLFPIPKKI